MKEWSGQSGNVKYLTDDELRRFFSSIKKRKKESLRRRDLCLFSLMLSYGLRLSEAVELRLDDLRLENDPPQIFVRRKKRRTGAGCFYRLNLENVKLLKAWMKERSTLAAANYNPFLFIKSTATEQEHLSALEVYFRFREYSNMAGITGHSPHSLRHTCGVKLAKAGFNAFQIRDRLGHASVISTQFYVELGSPDRLIQDQKMDAALGFS